MIKEREDAILKLKRQLADALEAQQPPPSAAPSLPLPLRGDGRRGGPPLEGQGQGQGDDGTGAKGEDAPADHSTKKEKEKEEG